MHRSFGLYQVWQAGAKLRRDALALALPWLLVACARIGPPAVAAGGTTPAAPAATLAARPAATSPSPGRPLAARPAAPTLPARPTSHPTATPAPTSSLARPTSPLPSPTAGLTVEPSPTLPSLDPGARAARFDEVWQTVKQHYLYRNFRGVDWDAAKQHYRPRALAAANSEAFYATLTAMVGLLDDGHSRYASPQEAHEEHAIAAGSETYVGIGLVAIPAQSDGVIQVVFHGSPAEKAGLRRRDRIVLIDGQPYSQADPELRGPEGTTVRLEVQSPGEAPREVTVERGAVAAKWLAEAYRIGQTDFGYLLVQSLWPEDMGGQVRSQLQQLLERGALKGMIIDLRGNPGGWRSVLESLLANFMEGKAGEFFSQAETIPLDVATNDLFPQLRATPLVVLVDRDTESYAELIAGALQAAGRAKVVGTRTAGNTESVYGYDFADKSRLWIAQEGFRLPAGTSLEGRGVTPDVVMRPDWASFSEANDPYILKALDLLRRESEAKRREGGK